MKNLIIQDVTPSSFYHRHFLIQQQIFLLKLKCHQVVLLNADGFAGLDDFSGFFDFNSTDIDAKFDFEYNTLDFLGHKNITVCNCVDMQLFAGARYPSFREDYHKHFSVPEDLIEAALE